MQLSILSSLRN